VEFYAELGQVLEAIRGLKEEGEIVRHKQTPHSIALLQRRKGEEEERLVVFTKAYPYDDEVFQIQEALGVGGETIVYIATPGLLPKILSHLKDPPAEPLPTVRRVEEAKEVRLDTIDFVLARSFPKHLAERTKAIPIGLNPDGSVRLLMANPHNLLAIDDARLFLKRDVVPIGAPEQEVVRIIHAIWSENLENLVIEEEAKEANEEALSEEEGPARLFLYNLLREAAFDGASDIHFDPESGRVAIRFRVDGVLSEFKTIAKSFYPSVLSVIKLMSGMDITERRLPQDGRLRYKDKATGIKVDARVSTVAGVYGEKVVMRLLKRAEEIPELEGLGFSKDNYEKFLAIVQKPYGMILVTGPTGSGKSFTNFSVLKRIATKDKNTLTVEDPVEYEIPGITQVPVNPQIGVTFARVLRTFLRQDPDIIMVGEIRDPETAKIATEAALTGHLVLATLHTNDAPQAVVRLEQMGVERWNIGASLLGVLSQRLVRTLCSKCKRRAEDPALEKALEAEGLKRLAPEPEAYRPVGCDHCRGTGYKGRTAIHELMVVTPRIRQAIYDGANASKIKKIAIEEGMLTLRMDGLLKAARGITTLEEVLARTVE
jgi:type IV pilus assembly protein PilB